MGEKGYETLNVPNEFNLEVFYSLASSESYKGCILCIPGICHGAWCFENFLEFFPKNGFDCFALSFRGHAGSLGYGSLNKFGLSDYSEDIKVCINYCLNEKKVMRSIPFLLGHSMGGAVVQKYLGEHSDTVRGGILFASATAGGMPFWKTMKKSFFKTSLLFANIKALFSKINDNMIAKSAFFNGRIKSKKDIHRYNTLLHRESWKILFCDLYKEYTNTYDINIPVFVIGSDKDDYFPTDSLNTTADFYNTKPMILRGLCHDMMLDPEMEKAAESVLEFMKNPNELKNDPQKFIENLENKIYPKDSQ